MKTLFLQLRSWLNEYIQSEKDDPTFRYSISDLSDREACGALLIQNGEVIDLVELLMTLKQVRLQGSISVSLLGGCLVIRSEEQEKESLS